MPEIDLTGARIHNYLFMQHIGGGGFAEVYLAQQLDVASKRRLVAIKVFLAPQLEQGRQAFNEVVHRVRRDLNPLIELESYDGIIRCFTTLTADLLISDGKVVTISSADPELVNTGTVRTAFMIVMEYADGGTLGQSYREELILTGKDRVWLAHFIQVCEGLQTAHDKGIIHNDIKPNNLFYFRKSNRVRIGDFGIAASINELNWGGGYATPEYLAPEAFHSQQPTPARDIYALGCTFFEILAGHPPFRLPPSEAKQVSSLDAWHELHANAERPLLINHSKFASLELSSLVRRMMDPSPQLRPSLNEVIKVLKNLRLPTVVADRLTANELEHKPTWRSAYLLNPAFRAEVLNERLFFIFVRLRSHTQSRIERLMETLNRYFGRAWSFWETFGYGGFIVRVWSQQPDLVAEFAQECYKKVIEGKSADVTVFPCEKVNYLFDGKVRRPFPEKSDALSRIFEAQENDDPAAVKWLRDKKLYVKDPNKAASKGLPTARRVTAIVGVRGPDITSNAERSDLFALINNAIQTHTSIDPRDLAIVTHQRTNGMAVSNSAVEEAVLSPYDCLITFSAPYEQISKIPELILEHFKGGYLTTTTFPESLRYLLWSDLVHQPQSHMVDAIEQLPSLADGDADGV